MSEADVREQMRAEWNERAREDAHYYVAFGRREQDDEEFFATASDVIRALEAELKRLPARGEARRVALEIGCGPGRLMKPMSCHFDQIHGIDVADEMIGRAHHNLRDVAHAFPRHASGSDLAFYGDASMDFVYSYAVFQHIPSREVVLSYFREIVRVLKPGGVAHLQVNGLRPRAGHATTWDGVRFTGDDIRDFTRTHRVELLLLDGMDTQYMWTTWRKPLAPRIRMITNSHTGEHAVPASGTLACCSVWVENMPGGTDLNTVEVLVDGRAGTGCYVGLEVNGLTQINVLVPEGTRTGMVPVAIRFHGGAAGAEAWMRVIRAGAPVPRIHSVTDGTNLLSERRIVSGAVKVFLEEINGDLAVSALVDGQAVRELTIMCTDPRNQRYDCSFRLPENTAPGWHELRVSVGTRVLPTVPIEVV